MTRLVVGCMASQFDRQVYSNEIEFMRTRCRPIPAGHWIEMMAIKRTSSHHRPALRDIGIAGRASMRWAAAGEGDRRLSGRGAGLFGVMGKAGF